MTTSLREATVGEHRLVYDLATTELAIDLAKPWQDPAREPLLPVPQVSEEFISAATLFQKAKSFDDGLYAAIELASDPGKRAFVAALAGRLANVADAAADVVRGAAILDGAKIERAPSVNARLKEFLGDALRSKPISFYTWTPDLARIFQRDRLLQTELPAPDGIGSVARVIEADRELAQQYQAHLDLAARLTNPLKKGAMILPPSIAPETELIKKLYGDSSLPSGFDLASELVARIRKGDLSLEPQPESGFYDHQLWSLEPLVAPRRTREGARFVAGEEYRDHLVELFKATYALTRETHAKQVDLPMAGAGMFPDSQRVVVLQPSLSIDPLATSFLRRAASYDFVRGVLESAFGRDALRAIRRRTPDGETEQNLADELASMALLFRGAHALACNELAIAPEIQDVERAAAAFDSFVARLTSDRDVMRDARMLVPVFFDIERRLTKVWAFMGWRLRAIWVAFTRRPNVQVFDKQGRDVTARVWVKLGATRRTVVEPVVRELYVSKILDRDEMRALCDRAKTERAIAAALTQS